MLIGVCVSDCVEGTLVQVVFRGKSDAKTIMIGVQLLIVTHILLQINMEPNKESFLEETPFWESVPHFGDNNSLPE